jgi:hypothetical protein
MTYRVESEVVHIEFLQKEVQEIAYLLRTNLNQNKMGKGNTKQHQNL